MEITPVIVNIRDVLPEPEGPAISSSSPSDRDKLRSLRTGLPTPYPALNILAFSRDVPPK
ncbi:MAG: hypothetical protein RMH77_04900 [Sulfolobales archaeon]|nr:hypothetical protein [Sulfolobales archaeon]MDW7969722.1 hypothetical protein [Sulfolobales archaeon]